MIPTHLGRTLVNGVILSALLFGLFILQNSGLALRPDDDADPQNDSNLAIALIGILSFVSIVVAFGRGSHLHERQKRDGGGPTFRIVLNEYSLTGIMAIGLVTGAFLSLTALLCRLLAVDTGVPGTIWADLHSNPLAFAALFAAAWASANISIAFAAMAMALRRTTLTSLISIVVFIPLLVGIVFAFLWLDSASTATAFVVAVPVLAVSMPLLIGSRKLALVVGTD